MTRQLLPALCGLALLLCLAPATAQASPRLLPPPPADARSEMIADEITLNGQRLQLGRVLSPHPPDTLAAHYQQHFDGQLAVSEVASTRILALELGQHFLTIRIQPVADGGSEALLALSALPASTRSSLPQALLPLPAGSELLSQLEHRDRGRNTIQLIFRNRHSLQANFRYLQHSLQARGLQRAGERQQLQQGLTHAWLQDFSGAQHEARVMLMSSNHHSTVVLTLLGSRP